MTLTEALSATTAGSRELDAMIARFGLTIQQVKMLMQSEPDDITGEEGCGVELLTGADYAVAKALKRRGFGYVEGPGGPLSGMYFNNAEGLALLRALWAAAGEEG